MRYLTNLLPFIFFLSFQFTVNAQTDNTYTFEGIGWYQICFSPTGMKHELRPSSKKALEDMLAVIKANPTKTFEISDHTDTRGSAESNLVNSKRRLNTIMEYLDTNGIDTTKISGIAYGESKPLTPEAEINPYKRTDQQKFKELSIKNNRLILRVKD